MITERIYKCSKIIGTLNPINFLRSAIIRSVSTINLQERLQSEIKLLRMALRERGCSRASQASRVNLSAGI